MPDSSQTPPGPASGADRFLTTHWSAVLRAGGPDSPQTQDALAELCRAYWRPLYAFARLLGSAPAEAEDLTQGFFARLLESHWLAEAQRERGRFRTFLLTAFKRFRANEWDRQHAQKRGGFQRSISINQDEEEARLGVELADAVTPELIFERQWAVALLDQVMKRLREEYVASGRDKLFELLQARLAPDETAPPYTAIAGQLRVTEAAVKMAVHRLRARYREILREEIAKTVSSPEEVEDEIRHLFATF